MLVEFDESAWVERFSNLYPDIHSILGLWSTLREANLRVYESIRDNELQRWGVHSTRGDESVELTPKLRAGHALVHIAQTTNTLALSIEGS